MSGAITARRTPGVLDLTDTCTEAVIGDLRNRATGAHGQIAAVCIWPRLAALAKSLLADTDVKVATVVSFPSGDDDTIGVEQECRDAPGSGADEIDMVFARTAFLKGRRRFAETQVIRMRETVSDKAGLKVIFEAGELKDPDLIRPASEIAINAFGRPCGIKASGGVRTTDDAAHYLSIADRLPGPAWAGADTFRFGGSGLSGTLDALIEGADPAPRGEGY